MKEVEWIEIYCIRFPLTDNGREKGFLTGLTENTERDENIDGKVFKREAMESGMIWKNFKFYHIIWKTLCVYHTFHSTNIINE
ncbi:MAG TPA: hypothetical protein VMZ04_04990 [Anaerolineae bacterium]|nr:hypothetical protein [Anaerolineae bacterium]